MKHKFVAILFLIIFFLPTHVHSYDMTTYDFLENKPEMIDQETFYTPFPEGKSQPLLPICFLAHILEKLSYFMSGYIVLSAGLKLKEDLHEVNNNHMWPIAWFTKFGYWGQFSFTIAVALVKVLLLRWGVKLIINTTCPEELKKVKHRNQYQTMQEKTKSI